MSAALSDRLECAADDLARLLARGASTGAGVARADAQVLFQALLMATREAIELERELEQALDAADPRGVVVCHSSTSRPDAVVVQFPRRPAGGAA